MSRRRIIPSRPHSYVQRSKLGQFKEWTNRGKSQKADMRTHAKSPYRIGYGHISDKPRKKK